MKLINMIRRHKAEMNRVRFVERYVVMPMALMAWGIVFYFMSVELRLAESLDQYEDLVSSIPVLEELIRLRSMLHWTRLLILVTTLVYWRWLSKKEISLEIARYQFRDDGTDIGEIALEFDGGRAVFAAEGIHVDGQCFAYEQTEPLLLMKRRAYRVYLSVAFHCQGVGALVLPLFGKNGRVVIEFNIPLRNQGYFDFIFDDPQWAFRQMCERGKIKRMPRIYRDDPSKPQYQWNTGVPKKT